jgi:hypothetical protein
MLLHQAKRLGNVCLHRVHVDRFARRGLVVKRIPEVPQQAVAVGGVDVALSAQEFLELVVKLRSHLLQVVGSSVR